MDNEKIELAAMIKAQAEYHKAPSGLRERVAMSLQQADLPCASTKAKPAHRSWWSMGGAFAFGIMLSMVGMFVFGLLGQQNRDVEHVVDNHVRSMLVAHLSDVASSDKHTVKPWFDGKIDYSPPVRDFAAEGFPLVGGRLDYINGHTVAALVYRCRLHSINVFIWPARSSAILLPGSTSLRGFNVKSWQDDGMEFWAVSDAQPEDLQTIERLLRTRPADHP